MQFIHNIRLFPKIFLLLLGAAPLLSMPPIIAQVQKTMSVSAIVPPNNSDFQFAFASIDRQTTVPQNTILSYKITYGAQASAGVSTTTTIVADWQDAIAPNGANVLDYVLSSAENTYNNTPPVVDLTNRTITWTIPNVPSGTTNQTIHFQLKTNNNYTEGIPVDFIVRTKMSNQFVTLSDKIVQQTYGFNTALVTPTPTITLSPTTQPTSTPTPQIPTPTKQTTTTSPMKPTNSIETTTPTPIVTVTPPPDTLRITDVSIRGITQSSATIAVTTNQLTKLSVLYGAKSHSLTQSFNKADFLLTNNITIDSLSPNSPYYIRITVIDKNGKQSSSETFTFTTAQTSQPPNVDDNVVVLTSSGNVLISEVGGQKDRTYSQTVLLTTDTDFEFTYKLKDGISLKRIEAVLRNKHVLAFDTISQNEAAGTITVPMIEKEPGVYFARVKALTPGIFEVFVKLTDTKGNVVEQKVGELKFVSQLTVYDSKTKQPIASSRVYLYHFNNKTQKYEPLNKNLFREIKNPSYTDEKGEIKITLPQGKYQAKVSAFGYQTESTNFSLGSNKGEEFPTIYLQKESIIATNLLPYLRDTTSDLFSQMIAFLHALPLSARFFNSLAVMTVVFFIILSLFLFLMRTHISLMHLPSFILHHLELLFKLKKTTYIIGLISDKDKHPLSRVRIECVDEKTGQVLSHVSTNKAGKFYLHGNLSKHTMHLLITKDGYLPKSLVLTQTALLSSKNLQITLNMVTTPSRIFFWTIFETVERIVSFLFEIVLILSLLLELLFFSLFGFAQTLPFLALSLINILLWVFFIRERFEQRGIQ